MCVCVCCEGRRHRRDGTPASIPLSLSRTPIFRASISFKCAPACTRIYASAIWWRRCIMKRVCERSTLGRVGARASCIAISFWWRYENDTTQRIARMCTNNMRQTRRHRTAQKLNVCDNISGHRHHHHHQHHGCIPPSSGGRAFQSQLYNVLSVNIHLHSSTHTKYIYTRAPCLHCVYVSVCKCNLNKM